MRVVGDVAWLLTSVLRELSVDVQDIMLVGEDSRVSSPLFVEENEVGD